MTDQNRHRLWQLVLTYEDLDPDQRRLVDEELARDPALRRDWGRLQALEKQAVLDWTTSDSDFWRPVAGPDETRQSEVSLERMLAALPAQVPFGSTAGMGRKSSAQHRSWGRILLPLAAVLAMLVFLPRLASENRLVGPLSVRPISLADDGTRSAQSRDLPAGQLRTGEAFVLDLSPETSGWLVVYHVDPQGVVTQVYADATPQPAAGVVTIPPADSGDFWVLSGEPGAESFIVGAIGEAAPELAMLEAAVAAANKARSDHDAAVAVVSGALQKHLTDVRVVTFDHVD